MGRRRKGRAVSGWLILDKPEGVGSTEAVSKVRWLFGAAKAGHAGTLDPLASGLLPIALGDATRTVPHVMEGTKVYRFTTRWGEERTTDDREGEVLASSDARPTRDQIEALLPRYTGAIEQQPPTFSAIKVDGQRAYDLARRGEPADLPARPVTVHRFDLIEATDDEATFEVECGKGTYVRSLARDMGRDLGCRGYVSALRRTAVAPFDEEDLVPYADVLATELPKGDGKDDEMDGAAAEAARAARQEERHAALDAQRATLDGLLLDTAEALAGQPCVSLTADQASRVLSGNPVILRGRDAPLPTPDAHAVHRGKLVALGRIDMGAFHPSRVFGG